MKGSYKLTVQAAHMKYELELSRNITILRGDSATGKTVLVEMIQEYNLNGSDTGIQLSCEKPCRVIAGNTWKEQLVHIEESIVFIDEGNRFVSSEDFARTIRGSNNYYVIVTRENLDNLPYSVTEIYGIHSSGKYNTAEPVYHHLHRIYPSDLLRGKEHPNMVIVEDSNAGYEFFEHYYHESDVNCISAKGSGNIFDMIHKAYDGNVVVIADGAAFGAQMGRVFPEIRRRQNIRLYLPESFEWIILSADILENSKVRKILENPSEFIDGEKYFSWERYFTQLLSDETRGTYLAYVKSSLNTNYLIGKVYTQIIDSLPEQIKNHCSESNNRNI